MSNQTELNRLKAEAVAAWAADAVRVFGGAL